MIGIYFSGTGNSRYAVEVFLREYDATAKAFSIEDNDVIMAVSEHEEIIFSYPVQYSNVPKMLQDFINHNHDLWGGKRVFVIATMGLFSGDGAGVLGRMLKKYGAEIIGGLHLKMPDSIGDEKVLKRSLEKNTQLVKAAERKIKKAVTDMKKGNSPKEGIGVFNHLAGLLGQRLYFGYKANSYTDKLKIDTTQCVGCGKCVKHCPMKNIEMDNKLVVARDRCTMCYRCVNQCPKQAITLLGKQVIEQSVIEKYI